jgi:hypothetical protein
MSRVTVKCPGERCAHRFELECLDTDQTLYCRDCSALFTFVNMGLVRCRNCQHKQKVPLTMSLALVRCESCGHEITTSAARSPWWRFWAGPTTAPAPPSAATGASSDEYRVGQRVLGCWPADHLWYPARIEELTASRAVVKFDDGDSASLTSAELQPLTIAVGERVSARRKGGRYYFLGRITQMLGEKIHIQYDDWQEEWTTVSVIRVERTPLRPHAPATLASDRGPSSESSNIVTIEAYRLEDFDLLKGNYHIQYCGLSAFESHHNEVSFARSTLEQVASNPRGRGQPKKAMLIRRLEHMSVRADIGISVRFLRQLHAYCNFPLMSGHENAKFLGNIAGFACGWPFQLAVDEGGCLDIWLSDTDLKRELLSFPTLERYAKRFQVV